jgi:Tfp pilus assembly protein PilW
VIARRLRNESGTSVIELVIVTAISIVILGAVLSMLDSGTKTERGTEARHSVLLALRGAVERVDKDLRQATLVASTSTTSCLDMQTYISGVTHRVVYQVIGGEFRRTLDGTVACTGTQTSAATLVSHMSTTAVFCYDPPTCAATGPPSPIALVRVSLAATPEVFSGGPISLATDIRLRNPQQ